MCSIRALIGHVPGTAGRRRRDRAPVQTRQASNACTPARTAAVQGMALCVADVFPLAQVSLRIGCCCAQQGPGHAGAISAMATSVDAQERSDQGEPQHSGQRRGVPKVLHGIHSSCSTLMELGKAPHELLTNLEPLLSQHKLSSSSRAAVLGRNFRGASPTFQNLLFQEQLKAGCYDPLVVLAVPRQQSRDFHGSFSKNDMTILGIRPNLVSL